MGDRQYEETEDQARGTFSRVRNSSCVGLNSLQSIIVLPRKNRLRVYVDSEDKYYRLRELKRGLPDVVVKVCPILAE